MTTLERCQVLPRPRAEVFAFFEDARNLEVMTPPFLHFRLETEGPIAMRAGTLIDYRLSLFGVPFHWRTEITEYVRAERFVDRQLRGPYRVWEHTHLFEDIGGHSTQMSDRVRYEVGFGPLGPLASSLFVHRTVKRIFDYRAEVIAQRFA